MFRTFLAAAALTLALGSSAAAHTMTGVAQVVAGVASSVTGVWDLSINGPEGAITAVATLNQDGEKVTGSIESPQGKAELSGTIKGKALNVSFSIAGPNGSLDVKVNGEVDGASMKGIIDFGMGMADFTAKKK